MNHKEETSNTHEKATKPNAIVNALLIGFFVGIVIFSVIENTWGLLTLIPLFFIYKLVNKKPAAENG